MVNPLIMQMNSHFIFTASLLWALFNPNINQAQQDIDNIVGFDLSELQVDIQKRQNIPLKDELEAYSPLSQFESLNDSIYQVTVRNGHNKVERKYQLKFRTSIVIRYIENLETGEKTEVRSELWYGQQHGPFEQFLPQQVLGQFDEGIACGEWKIDKPEQYTIAVNFGQNGLPQGVYQEYYGTMVKHTGIKTHGTYTPHSKETGFLCDHCYKDEVGRAWSIRTGKWELFHRGGALAQTIQYNQPEKR
jgi:hypothetical protein